MEKKFNANLCISRINCFRKEDYIRIEIQDNDSRVIITTLNLPLAKFAQALTGLHIDDIPAASWVDDDRIGKKRVRIIKEIELPQNVESNTPLEIKEWLHNNYPEKPAPIAFNYSSRGSKFNRDGKTFLRYYLHTYVENDEDE